MEREGRQCGSFWTIYGSVLLWPQTYPLLLKEFHVRHLLWNITAHLAQISPEDPYLMSSAHADLVHTNELLILTDHHTVFTCFWLWGLWCGQLFSAYRPPARGSVPPPVLTPCSAQESALCQAQKAAETKKKYFIYIYVAHLVQMNQMLHK